MAVTKCLKFLTNTIIKVDNLIFFSMDKFQSFVICLVIRQICEAFLGRS